MSNVNLDKSCGSGDTQSEQSTTKEKIVVEIYHSFEALAHKQQEWDKFIESVGGEIFLTYDWCRIWWKYYGKGRKLLIVVFRYGGELVGLLPVFHEKIWIGFFSIRCVKIVGTDFTTITVSIPIKHQFIDSVLSCFRRLIEKEWEWDIIRIGAIAGKYEFMSELANGAKKAFLGSYTVAIKEEDVETYFDVPANWDEYLKLLSTKQRTNARRAFKTLKSRNLNVTYHYVDRETLNESFDNFVQMHQKYWNTHFRPGHFKAWPEAYEFHREQARVQAEKDRLRLLQITLDGKCVAYEYSYRNGKMHHWFLYGRSMDAYELGFGFHWIALRAKLESAADEGVTYIDDMRGKYDYKLLMGGKVLPISSLFIYSAKFPVMQRIFVFRLLVKVLNILYYKIWRIRLAPRLGIKLKTYWGKWVRFGHLSP